MKRTGGFILGLLSGIILFGLASYYFLSSQSREQGGMRTSNFEIDSFASALQNSLDQLGSGETCEAYSKYDVIYELLDAQYLGSEELDRDRMLELAVKGFVDAIGDPYTSYFTVTENEAFDEEMQGSMEFEGIGAVVTKKEQGVLIEELIKGGPAFKAGILPLDILLEADGESLKPLTINEAVGLLRGPKGSEVTLLIYRESANEVMEIIVTRDEISLPSVRGELLTGGANNILYIEVAIFGEDTTRAFREIVREHKDQFDGVILDLRGNGGGYMPIAVDLASFFLPENELVTSSEYISFPDQEFRSKGYSLLEGYPVVVLIDGISASASEILAAALDQRGGAVLVGQKTFGKGTIQTLHEFGDGSMLKYTVGEWFPPNQKNVSEVGLTPDIEVELDIEGYLSGGVDNQLEAGKEELIKLLQ